ncbi:uncharacterized protein N7518_000919 [Penicillium psychrosexuale]|uniref:uncharacterized protein n=1 Tax=Penicillium psychrosexuale TaxID=1002107 RepID=UPI002545BD37|nr:uncharacterized protein N7518_000919 [Penicillium psychrosexuale]KAJ5804616.1 hypothetical protein N7518_000919 [Penicillium psychrosexuale]
MVDEDLDQVLEAYDQSKEPSRVLWDVLTWGPDGNKTRSQYQMESDGVRWAWPWMDPVTHAISFQRGWTEEALNGPETVDPYGHCSGHLC